MAVIPATNLTVAVVVETAVTALIVSVVATVGWTVIEYGFTVNAVGNVIVPAEEVTPVTVPHCNSKPLGNLLCPEVDMLGVPNVKVVGSKVPVTYKLLETVRLLDITVFTVAVTCVELAIKTLAPVVLALILTFVPPVTKITGPLVLPVVKVKFVVPSAVLTKDVVNVDIRL